MKKAFFIIALALGILLIALAALTIYITSNESALKNKLVKAINKRTHGQTSIGSISTGSSETFPFLSIKITDLVIRDSAYQFHKKDLLSAKNALLRISLLKIFSDVKLDRVILQNGRINIIKSDQFDNTYVFRTSDKEKDEQDEKPDAAKYPDIEFRQMILDYTYPERNKHHHILAKKLLVELDHNKNFLEIDADIDFNITQVAFNTSKGGYLTNSTMQTALHLVYNKKTRLLSFNKQTINFNNKPYQIAAAFSLNKAAPDFSLSISTNKASLKEISAILPKAISSKINDYKLEGDFSVEALIKGRTTYKFKPLVQINMDLPNGEVQTKMLTLSNASFKARFYNEADKNKPRDDENSTISFYNLKGNIEKIPVATDSMIIANLKKPVLKTRLNTEFPLKDLNEISGSETMKFTAGKALVDLNYSGPITENDSTPSTLNGNIIVKDGGMTYLPRQFQMNNADGKIILRGNHVYVEQLKLNTGKTNITMNGMAENFLSMLNISPDKLLLKWNIYSPHLYLEDYKGFLTKRPKTTKSRDKALLGKTAGKIDKMFTEGNVELTLNAGSLDYRKFHGEDLKANIELLTSEARVNNVSLQHAGGTMQLKGTMKEGDRNNFLQIQSTLKNIHLPTIFTAFADFGQDAITSKNIEGKINATVNLKTEINDQAQIQREMNAGTIDFLISDFELNNFEPIQKISQKVFKKQDFTKIKFADLKNRLIVDGTAFKMDRMEIRSTALTMFVRGTYDVKNGTDMRIVLPVRNLMGSNADTDLSDTAQSKRGISIRLRAQTGDDGKLKVGWDPLRRGGKITD